MQILITYTIPILTILTPPLPPPLHYTTAKRRSDRRKKLKEKKLKLAEEKASLEALQATRKESELLAVRLREQQIVERMKLLYNSVRCGDVNLLNKLLNECNDHDDKHSSNTGGTSGSCSYNFSSGCDERLGDEYTGLIMGRVLYHFCVSSSSGSGSRDDDEYMIPLTPPMTSNNSGGDYIGCLNSLNSSSYYSGYCDITTTDSAGRSILHVACAHGDER